MEARELNPTYREIVEEIANIAPQLLENVLLRLRVRKLEAALGIDFSEEE